MGRKTKSILNHSSLQPAICVAENASVLCRCQVAVLFMMVSFYCTWVVH